MANDDERADLLNSFQNELKEFANQKEDNIASLLERDEKEIDFKKLCLNTWRTASKNAERLLNVEIPITSTSWWKMHIKLFISESNSLKNGAFPDIMSRSSFMLVVTELLSRLLKEIHAKRSFVALPSDVNAVEALDQYINIGNAIVDAKNYKDSIMHQFDCLLKDMRPWIDKMFSDMFVSDNYVAEDSYIVLAAPSMEDKTQAAFTLRQVKPLYSPLSEADESSCSQPIYANFRAHVRTLRSCAEADLMSIHSRNNSREIDPLDCLDYSLELWTVGFLISLVDPKISAEDWMRHYAKKESFIFERKTIAAALNGRLFVGYCLFLDEFSDQPWSDYLRRLARIMGLCCVYSDSNARSARLSRRKRPSGAGAAGLKIYSIVLVRLDPPNKDILDCRFGLQGSIDVIKRASPSGNPIHRFLDHFVKNQLKYLRPGVAIFVAKALKLFSEFLGTDQVNLVGFLDHVTSQVSTYLIDRKPSLVKTGYASLGKMGLLFPESYFPAKPGQIQRNNAKEMPQKQDKMLEFLKSSSILEHHLYYLRNPQFKDENFVDDERSWIFLTVPSRDESKPDCLGTLIRGSSASWPEEVTHFEPNELFTFLGCLFVPYSWSPMALLPACYLSLAICIIDASQHSNEYQNASDDPLLSLKQVYSFRGLSGTTFIQNLVGNLVNEKVELKPEKLVKVQFPTSAICDFLGKCKIPFLYSVERPIKIFKELSTASSGDSEFFVEEYSDSEDRFPIIYDGKDSHAVVHCDFVKDYLAADDLKDIIEEINIETKLILVFCNSFCNSCTETGDSSSLVEYCKTEERRMNVYKVVKLDYRSYEIVPLFAQFSDPKIVCVVFEMNVINSLTICPNLHCPRGM